MKLSKETVQVLKNFSMINKGLVIDEKSVLKTQEATNSFIIGVYDCQEKFPIKDSPIGIYDFPEFLSILSTFNLDNLDIERKDDFLILKEGKIKVKYKLADPEMIQNESQNKPSSKFKKFDKFDGSFNLSKEELSRILKSSRAMGFNMMDVTIKDGEGSLVLKDTSNDMSNSMEMDIKGEGDCSINLNIDHMLIIEGDYKISVCNDTTAKFENTNSDLFYFVAASF